MNTFKGHKGNISWFGLNGLLVNEYLFPKIKAPFLCIYTNRFELKNISPENPKGPSRAFIETTLSLKQ